MLVCRRPVAKRHGGLWEFPGGKAEPSETDADAAARELQEELRVRLVRAAPTAFEIADPDSSHIIAFIPVEIEGEPVAIEHSGMQWGHPRDLAELPLAPCDRAFLEWMLSRNTARQ
jgi:mutator protein MutT